MNTQRDRLIELITKSQLSVNSRKLADYLLENGVIVPPCKVGDTVYYINRSYHIELKKDNIYEAKVVRIVTTSLGTSLVIHIRGEWGCIQQPNIDCIETPDVKAFDRTVFLTREEAEKALSEKGKNNDKL